MYRTQQKVICSCTFSLLSLFVYIQRWCRRAAPCNSVCDPIRLIYHPSLVCVLDKAKKTIHFREEERGRERRNGERSLEMKVPPSSRKSARNLACVLRRQSWWWSTRAAFGIGRDGAVDDHRQKRVSHLSVARRCIIQSRESLRHG